MKEKKLKIKNTIINFLKESDDSFFYLAPDIIGSINNANLDLGRNTFNVGFKTTDGRNMNLIVPDSTFQKWNEENNDAKTIDFLIYFIKCSNPINDNKMLDEIVDEYGDLIPDEDMPSNGNFRYVGKSKFDTAKTIKQTIPKSKRYYGDLGLGVITW